MKPKNRVYCPDCGRPKMLFETERKASDFIRWNGDEIFTGGGELRPYYCPACCGWHISHQQHKQEYDTRTDDMIDAYRHSIQRRSKGRIDRLIADPDREGELERRAVAILGGLPEDVRRYADKRARREYVTRYLKDNGIEDVGGRLRGVIYKLWDK